MSAYQLFRLPKNTLIDSSVRVLPGAKAYFYATTTSTPQDTFTTSALNVAHPNPVVADANGVLPAIYLDANLQYKLTLNTSADVLIYTVDPVNDQVLSPINVGEALWPRTALEISAGVHPADFSYEPFDPRRYSSVADWTAVYNQVNLLNESYAGWYRGDRAQHFQLTNCIVGFGAYNDAAMTGTLGYRCTAFGVGTLSLNSTSTVAGGSNTAIGFWSMRDSVDVSGNTGVGTSTLASCTGVNSAHNGAFGNACLEALVTGTQNNGFAYRAMYQLVRGNNNTGSGDVVLQGLIAGDANTCYGAQAGFTKPGGNYLNAFGYQACFHETSANISAITNAATCVVTITTGGGSNPFAVNDYVTFGDVSGMTQVNDLSGIVTATGGSTGAWTVSVAVDTSAFSTYTSGGYLSPYGNCAFGYKTQFENTYASGNSTFGTETASTAAMGIANSLFGFQAGRVINGATFNSVFGWRSGLALTSGGSNCLFGQQSGSAVTTGGSNVLLGASAGSSISTGSNNTAVGTGAGTANGSNRQSIGYNAQCNGDNVVTLGDTNIIQIRAQVTTITAISDARDKTDIVDIPLGLDLIEKLRPVRFTWNQRDGNRVGMKDCGFIAQELAAAEGSDADWLNIVSHTDPEHLEASPGRLIPVLVKAIQELSARVKELEAR